MNEIVPRQLDTLASTGVVRVREVKNWAGLVTEKGRFVLEDERGAAIGEASEVGSGVADFFFRQFLQARRPFTIEIRGPSGELAVRLVRPWRFLFASLSVEAGGGLLGTIQQRFKLFGRRYDILSPTGTRLATIDGPMFRPWTFEVHRGATEVAKIQKRWAGLAAQLITDENTFAVELGPTLEPELRTLVLAATFLIDFVHFERSRD
jgi:uncharacterized protein YxjI